MYINKNIHYEIIDAAVASIRRVTDTDPAAAFCMGTSIFYTALVPMVGQYLSLLHNAAGATILPEFQPILQEIGPERFLEQLRFSIAYGHTLIPERFSNATADLGGFLTELVLEARTFEREASEGEQSKSTSIVAYVSVGMRSRYGGSGGGLAPNPSQDQTFFPRSFCTALALEGIKSSGNLPQYISLTGGSWAWEQCLLASTAA